MYGTSGVASASNLPGGRGVGRGWATADGTIWLFGGFGLDAGDTELGELDDVWQFSSTTNEWTWVAGSSGINKVAVYGSEGVAAPTNDPGGRSNFCSWTDTGGNLWTFGGAGYEIPYPGGSPVVVTLGDMWMFNVATKTWAWTGGSQSPNNVSVYGTVGVAAAGNAPGAREQCAVWTDASGNFWLFGGYGFFEQNGTTDLSDLWEFKPSTQQWTWMGGSQTGATSGVYGTEGTASANNLPGAREIAATWTDQSGNLWLFGGYGDDSAGTRSYLNDLWEFNPSTMQWTWVAGSNLANAYGNYGTQGAAAGSNQPGARGGATAWTDASGNLWLFGGLGYGTSGASGELGDLWKFDVSTKQWTWVGGSNQVNVSGTYGTKGAPASGNFPGGRDSGIGFTDASGNLWLFGGYAADSSGPDNVGLNDLWRYQP
ncbi:MAG: kelch repeat-containing protein [Acidobacteriaceae bacterium]